MSLKLGDAYTLLARAKEASVSAYTIDDRKFEVGAVILSYNGIEYEGCNIEFRPQSLTMCAERVALFNFVQDTSHSFAMRGMAVYVNQPKIYTSCGPCLQAFANFVQDPDEFLIIYSGESIKDFKTFTFRKLFPYPYYHTWK